MADVFISYAREDIETAHRLADALEAQGWSVFWDRTIPPGQSWRSHIGQALYDARCVIVLWSEHSLGSEFVHEEADAAKRRDVLLPVLIESVAPPLGFGEIQAADLIGWDGDVNANAFPRFLNAVTTYSGPSLASNADAKGNQAEAKRREEEEREQQRRKREDAKRRREHEAKARRLKEETKTEKLASPGKLAGESTDTSVETGVIERGNGKTGNTKPILISVVALVLLSVVIGIINYLAQTDLMTIRDAGATLRVGESTTFRSLNYPDRFIRHKNFIIELTVVSGGTDKEDSTFITRAGLAGQGLSFESVNFPRHFLCLEGFKLRLASYEDNSRYRFDATFMPRQGLADSREISFESISYPGHFIRHFNFQLVIAQGSGERYQSDATFIPEIVRPER